MPIDKKRKSLEKRKAIITKYAKFGETLLEFQKKGSSSSLFLDPEFGEFRGSYYSFIKGILCHPKRRPKQEACNKLSFEEAKIKLSESNLDHIEIVQYAGTSTGVSVFLDKEYGIFYGNFYKVVRGEQPHPERSKKTRSILSKKMWQNPEYVKKIKSSGYDKNKACEKRKKTMTNLYGVEHALQNKNSLEKMYSTMEKRYGDYAYAKTVDGKKKIRKAQILSGKIKTHNGIGMAEYADKLGKAYTTFQAQVKRYGFETAIKIKEKTTALETIFADMMKDLKLDFEEKKPIGGKIPDFIVEKTLIVETDGLFWHSDFIIKNKQHHKIKKDIYNSLGYQSFFFREDELLTKQEIIKSIVTNYLKRTPQKIYARKLSIKTVDQKTSIDFFNTNHLMGTGSGKTIGLFNNNELICAMQFKNRKKEIEISRFCSKLYHSVTGGFTKILSYLKQFKKSIMTFVDQRYGSGEYLLNLGFEKKTSYLSFKWTNGKKTFHRLKFPSNSGYNHGLNKIWDCGQTKFVLNMERQ